MSGTFCVLNKKYQRIYHILPCIMDIHVFVHIRHSIIIPMYNAHLYLSLKNLGKKSTHYT